MDAVRCYVDGQPRSWDNYLSPLAGALRSAVNRNTGFTPNRLVLGREENIPATLMYKPPEYFQNRGEVGVDQYVSDLHKQILKTHELARDKLKSSQKSMKRDFREQKFKVGDLVYWRRNVVKKVESVWRGPGVIIYVNSNSVYIL